MEHIVYSCTSRLGAAILCLGASGSEVGGHYIPSLWRNLCTLPVRGAPVVFWYLVSCADLMHMCMTEIILLFEQKWYHSADLGGLRGCQSSEGAPCSRGSPS
jgi:hypothetical protein